MASTHDMAKYSIWKYASKTIEIDNFQTKTTNHDRKDECVSSNDDSFKFLVQLWSSLENKQTSSGYVYFSLQTYYKCLPESVVKFVVSLIDVKGEKQFTLS